MIDTISPVFSIPEAKNDFEISIDGGTTYKSASSIEIGYNALDKMGKGTYVVNENPVRILFRRKSNPSNSTFTISKILANSASIFDDPVGENVIDWGTQNATTKYFSGKYASYGSTGVTSGGLNFSDFKISPIQTTQGVTEMQLIFYVYGLFGVKFIGGSVTGRKGKVTLTTYVGLTRSQSEGNSRSFTKTNVAIGDTVTLWVRNEMRYGNKTSGWSSQSFRVGITQNQYLDIYQETPYATHIDPTDCSVTINSNSLWSGTPTVYIQASRFSVSWEETGDEFTITVPSGAAIYELVDDEWSWYGATAGTMGYNGTRMAYDYKGYWRFKTGHNLDAWKYGIQKSAASSSTIYSWTEDDSYYSS